MIALKMHESTPSPSSTRTFLDGVRVVVGSLLAVLGGLVSAGFTLGLCLYVASGAVLSYGQTLSGQPLPSPNGYDDFLTAAASLTGDVSDTSPLDKDRLKVVVTGNAEALRLVRLGLTRQCVAPLDPASTNRNLVFKQLAGLKELAQLLDKESRLRELDNQLGEAAASCVDIIKFGNEISRGGMIIHRKCGISCEAIGEYQLSKLVPRLGAVESLRVAAELQKIDSSGVTWEEIQRNEHAFFRHQTGKEPKPSTEPRSYTTSRQRTKMMHNSVVSRVRLLAAELAARCYQMDQKKTPDSLEQLVPKYLQRVPLDPFSGKALVYRSTGTNWLLYSVGEDKIDQGGKRQGRRKPGEVSPVGDRFYDSP